MWFAYSYPYTYTQLTNFLDDIELSGKASKYFKTINRYLYRKTLCRTILGNRCEYLTISSENGDKQKKKGSVITARTHPGESVGSWMMQGNLYRFIRLN